jgi:hypothetical protein
LLSQAAHHEEAKDREPDRPKESLLVAAVRMRKDKGEETEEQKQLDEEADIMKHVLQKQALKAVKELAQVRLLGETQGERQGETQRNMAGRKVAGGEKCLLSFSLSTHTHTHTRTHTLSHSLTYSHPPTHSNTYRTWFTPRAWTPGGSPL